MEELKARIELLKEQNPIKIQDLERKFGLLKFELQEAKKILERQEIGADVLCSARNEAQNFWQAAQHAHLAGTRIAAGLA